MTLSQALSLAAVPELPAELEEGVTDWIKAIVHVKKCNNRENYALAVNDGNGSMSIVKDFGSTCAIKEILHVYPYAKLSLKSRPVLRNKEEIVAYLVMHGENEEMVRQLLSSTTKSGKEKADATKANDKGKIKAMVNKYALAEDIELKAANNKAYDVAKYYNSLPELPEDMQ